MALLPAYVERKWWKEKVVDPKADIIFLVGRVAFERPNEAGQIVPGLAPRDPSAIVIFGPTATGLVGWYEWKRKKETNDTTEVLVSDYREDLYDDPTWDLDSGRDRGRSTTA